MAHFGKCGHPMRMDRVTNAWTCDTCTQKQTLNALKRKAKSTVKSKTPSKPKENMLLPMQGRREDSEPTLFESEAPPRIPTRKGPQTLKLKPDKPKEIPEKVVQQRILEKLFLKGWLPIRFNSGGVRDKYGNWVNFYRIMGVASRFSSSGLPDVIAFRADRFLMIEIKGKKGELRDSQLNFMRLAASRGMTVHICDDWNQVDDLISRLEHWDKSSEIDINTLLTQAPDELIQDHRTQHGQQTTNPPTDSTNEE